MEKYHKKNPDDLIGIDFLTRSWLANGKQNYSSICAASITLNVALMRHPEDPALNYRMGKIHMLLAEMRFGKAAQYSKTSLKLKKALHLLNHVRIAPHQRKS